MIKPEKSQKIRKTPKFSERTKNFLEKPLNFREKYPKNPKICRLASLAG